MGFRFPIDTAEGVPTAAEVDTREADGLPGIRVRKVYGGQVQKHVVEFDPAQPGVTPATLELTATQGYGTQFHMVGANVDGVYAPQVWLDVEKDAAGNYYSTAELLTDRLALPADTRLGGVVPVTPEQLAAVTRERDYFCQVYQSQVSSSVQKLPHNQWTSLLFQGEDYDLGGFHFDRSARLIAPIAGIYEVSGLIHFQANDTGRRGARYLVASTATATPSVLRTVAGFLPARNVTSIVAKPMRFTLQAGGWVELQAYQDSGVELNTFINTTDSTSMFSMHLVRAL